MKKFKYIKRVLSYFFNYKKLLFGVILTLAISGVIGMIEPFITAREYRYVVSVDIPNIIKYALIIFGIRVISTLISSFKSIIDDKLRRKVNLDVQKDITKELFRLETSNFDKKGTNFFIERTVSDSERLIGSILNIMNTIFRIISSCGVVVYILAVSYKLFIVVMIAGVISFLANRKSFSYFEKWYDKKRNANEGYQSTFSEIIRGIRDIKVLNLREIMTNKIIKNQEEINDMSNKEMIEMKFFDNVFSLLDGVFEIGVLLYSIYLVSVGEIGGESLLIVYMYYGRVVFLMNDFGFLYKDVKKMNLTMKNMFDILDSDEYPKEKFGNIDKKRFDGKIEFRNVTFGYDDKDVLKNINLVINPNDTIGFVGKSGSGKSTLFNLISKLYTVSSGDIFIDGININDFTENAIRGNISVITQEPYIFNMSIKENIRIVNPSASDDDIIEKCKLAEFDDYVQSLPLKYDTVVGENGVILSGGLKQRLAIARALLKDSEIILLDEATSALDNEIQDHIMNAIKNISKDYTILIIAHRLSTVIDCDKIVVIDDGMIKGFDTHDNLTKNNKIYNKLYKKELLK